MVKHASHRDLAKYAARGVPVEGYGSMSGVTGPGYGTGYLPEPLQRLFFARRDHIDYVIYSYGTPIAWRDTGVWILPAVSYSTTTAKQQGYLWSLDYLSIPRDCSLSEYVRTLQGLQRFNPWAGTPYGVGRWAPGPNWTPGA